MIIDQQNNILQGVEPFAEHHSGNKLLTNEELTALKVKAALEKYAEINFDLVDVFVYDDTISLNGIVNTKAQKEAVEDIIYMTVPGIVKVENNLYLNVEYAGAEVYEF